MSTTIRPEVSKKNKYWINRHRYYELKHFCLQYPIWRKIFDSADSMSNRPIELQPLSASDVSDPTARCALLREYYGSRMQMLETCADATDSKLGRYVLIGVTEGLSYDFLNARYSVPCCKDVYYDFYRKFFWLLDAARK